MYILRFKDLKNELNVTKIDTGDKFENLNQANENITSEVAAMNSQIQDLGGLHVFCFTSVGSWITIFVSSWEENNHYVKLSKLKKNNTQSCREWKKVVIFSENSCHFVILLSFT